MDDKQSWKRSEPKPAPEPERKDCGCGFGKSCIENQYHNWAPPHFGAAYQNMPKRWTFEEIQWMRENTGEPPPNFGKPEYPDHWANK